MKLPFLHLPNRLKDLFAVAAVALASSSLPAADYSPHFIVVGCDGMSPNGVEVANTPVMDRLMKEGAYTLHARGVMPTSSSPNWASMIMGAGPEQHGVTSNDWETNKFEIAPTVVGPGGIFPTIFSVIREQHQSAVTGVFHDWGGFGRLFERSMVTKIEDSDGPTNTIRHAMQWFRETKPEFLFIHLDHVDHAGHQYGHGTAEYYAAVEVADKLIGEVVTTLEDLQLLDQTTILVTADHGGVNKGHGGATMAEIEIPWIIRGPLVRPGHEIKVPVNTYDTAATIAYRLGLKTPSAWIAKPVLDAFKQ